MHFARAMQITRNVVDETSEHSVGTRYDRSESSSIELFIPSSVRACSGGRGSSEEVNQSKQQQDKAIEQCIDEMKIEILIENYFRRSMATN